MKSVKETLETWFNTMICKYPWIIFKYEMAEDGYSHRICVYPKCLVNASDDYCEDEIAFSMALDAKFPDNSVLFSTEEELFACSPRARVYKRNVFPATPLPRANPNGKLAGELMA